MMTGSTAPTLETKGGAERRPAGARAYGVPIGRYVPMAEAACSQSQQTRRDCRQTQACGTTPQPSRVGLARPAGQDLLPRDRPTRAITTRARP